MTEVTNTPETILVEGTVEATEAVKTADVVTTTESIEETRTELKNDIIKEATEHKSWVDNLPDELKTSNFVDKFKNKDLADVIKSAINAEKLIGKKVSDFSKEEMDAFMVKQGMPESMDGYELPEGVAEADTFKQAFHQAKLTKEQATALTAYMLEKQQVEATQAEETTKVKVAQAKEILVKEFGDAYDKRINLAKNTLIELGGPDLLQQINASGLGANPDFIKMMAKVGKEFGEHSSVGSDSIKQFGITPKDRQTALSQIMSDPAQMSAWKDPTHPNHNLVKSKVRELMDN